MSRRRFSSLGNPHTPTAERGNEETARDQMHTVLRQYEELQIENGRLRKTVENLDRDNQALRAKLRAVGVAA